MPAEAGRVAATPQPWNALSHARVGWLLGRAGIDALVLKGATTARWLYAADETREVGDVDVLVRPAEHDRAMRLLMRDAGYRVGIVQPIPGGAARHSVTLVSGDGQHELDLHHTFAGITVDAEQAWHVLWGRRVPFEIAGVELRQLDEVGRALLLVLHAACDGGRKPKTTADLARCLAVLSSTTWGKVLGLADELGARSACLAGLRTDPVGREVLAALGVDELPDAEWLLRGEGETYALHLHRITGKPWRERVRQVARAAWPTPAAMKAARPIAARGPLGMATARAGRTLRIVGSLPRVVITVRRARRATRAVRGGSDPHGR